MTGRIIYNLFMPVGFLFFLPGLCIKYRNRPGYKKTFAERFGFFTPERKRELASFRGGIWVHAVSVGETILALNLIKSYHAAHPERKFILSTSTTTAQELARKEKTEYMTVMFAPIDFYFSMKKVMRMLSPQLLIVMETEIWPNMIAEAKNCGAKLLLANARLSDRSAKGYRRFRIFFAPLFEAFDRILAQSENDRKRIIAVSAKARCENAGNMKFDQKVPENLPPAELEKYFGTAPQRVLLAASTHPGEEKLIAESFVKLHAKHPGLRLVLIPRHAERGGEVAGELKELGLSYFRKSTGEKTGNEPLVLLADTTGEMMKFINAADIVFVGKSLAGHDEGHNLIEPALLDKPVVTGSVVKNFRLIFDILNSSGALSTVDSDDKLTAVLDKLVSAPEYAAELGRTGGEIVRANCGAVAGTIAATEGLL